MKISVGGLEERERGRKRGKGKKGKGEKGKGREGKGRGIVEGKGGKKGREGKNNLSYHGLE